MSTVKEELKKVVAALPKDATWDDAIERILLRKSCEQALDDIEAGRGISNDVVLHNAEQRWLKKSSGRPARKKT